MDSTFIYALLASVLSSLGGLAGGFLLLVRERLARTLARVLIGFASGALLGVTFLDLLPEAIKGFGQPEPAMLYALLGISIFFLIERLLASMHRHQDEYGGEHGETGDVARAAPLAIIGDTVHNFLDGVVVAAAFVVSVPLGVATAASVLLHELPHEIADFAILLRSGMARRRVLVINVLSALVAPLGTVMAYFFSTRIVALQFPLLAIAAGNLLYLGATNLLPHLHHERKPRRVVLQIVLFFLGIAIIFVFPE